MKRVFLFQVTCFGGGCWVEDYQPKNKGEVLVVTTEGRTCHAEIWFDHQIPEHLKERYRE